MSLATRCTSCGTVFRVVQDQLKVSEGWVRCGRCDTVFNALEGLFDLDRDAPPEWTHPPAPPVHQALDVEIGAVDDTGAADGPRDPSLVDRIDEQIFGQRRTAFGALGGLARERTEPDFADARFDSESAEESAGAALPLDTTEAPAHASHDDAAPEFVRDAERRNRWQGSRARKLLGAGTVLLALAFITQFAHHQRDEIAARWPDARVPLTYWCESLGCTISAPRRIEDIVVESTSLSRGSGPDTFRLAVVLRNRTAIPVALPWLELSLTDANGELVARRALSPVDLQVPAGTLGGRAETSLQASLATGTSRVTGYTVEVFYP